MCANYPSDLTVEQRQLIRPLLPQCKKPWPAADRRQVVDANLHVVRSDCLIISITLRGPLNARCTSAAATYLSSKFEDSKAPGVMVGTGAASAAESASAVTSSMGVKASAIEFRQ